MRIYAVIKRDIWDGEVEHTLLYINRDKAVAAWSDMYDANIDIDNECVIEEWDTEDEL